MGKGECQMCCEKNRRTQLVCQILREKNGKKSQKLQLATQLDF